MPLFPQHTKDILKTVARTKMVNVYPSSRTDLLQYSPGNGYYQSKRGW